VSYICNGVDGNAGTAGPQGANALVEVIEEPSGANCAAGGQKIEAGTDENGNDTLDAAEVASTSYVCNGEAGSAGAAGAQGAPGPAGPQGPASQMIGGGSSGALQTNHYMSMFIGADSATEGDVEQVMPVGGTLSKFYVVFNDNVVGGGNAFAFTVRKNGADTGVTCTVSETQSVCSDTLHSAVFAAGDRISISSVQTGAPTNPTVRWTAHVQ